MAGGVIILVVLCAPVFLFIASIVLSRMRSKRSVWVSVLRSVLVQDLRSDIGSWFVPLALALVRLLLAVSLSAVRLT